MRSPAPAFDLRAALSRELHAALAELGDAAAQPRAVHRCRVHLKRARALARIGKACAPGLAAVFNESARAAMRMLAHAREAAALSEAAHAAGGRANKKTAAALDALAASLAGAAAHPPDVASARAALKDLLALAQVWPEASPRQIRKGAERIARRARRARLRGLESSDSALRHQWRKREKDRLFAATLLAAAWPYARRRKLSDKLGEALGAERDVRLLIDRIEATTLTSGSAKGDKRVLRGLERRLQRLSARADRHGARLRRDRV